MVLVAFCLLPSTLFAQKLLITPAAVTVEEGDFTEFTIVLSSEPTADVTVTIVWAGEAAASLDKNVLIFTRSDWDQGQTVRVTANEDMDALDQEGTLILIASGGGYTTSGITLTPEAVRIESVDVAVQLKAVVQDQDATLVPGVILEWSSADSSIAVVDSTGNVTGVGNGTTTITAALATASGITTIVVEDPTLILSDREILIRLYNATGGDEWTQRDGWLTQTPIGQWHGVETDKDERVIALRLPENGLRGVIPSELVGLSHLEILNLWGNSLTGSLPTGIGKLQRLRELDLGHANLEGEIPGALGTLARLRYLNLEYVPFTGSVPAELGALESLEFLNLYQNRLRGHLPAELVTLRNLHTFYLDGNSLTGSIPSEFVQLENLQTFYWQENDGLCAPGTADFDAWRSALGRDFQGPSCNQADLAVLTQLYERAGGSSWINSVGWLGGSALEQWYGIETDSLGRVTVIDLASNGLRGQLPAFLEGLHQLSVLRLNGNPLSGRLPMSLTRLELTEFQYANTDVCTPSTSSFQQWLLTIPTHVGTDVQCPLLSDREVLSVLYEATRGAEWTQQNGWLTSAPLGDWHGVKVNGSGQVVELALYDNNLRGRIPAELEEMNALALLDLSYNWLEGLIPPALAGIKTLKELYLETNLLSGPIPSELGTLPLEALYLHDNKLKGSIPPSLGNLSDLLDLRISQNQLTGRIPAELGNLSAVTILWMDDNQFEGEIPPELGNLTSILVLYAGNNQLTGAIPPELGNLQSILDLAFDGNQLSGPIPAELGKLESLNGELNLRENRLSGEIPPQLGNLTQLSMLRLSHNKLSGLVPPEIGQMHALKVLELSHNPELTAPLPSTLVNLVNLSRFDADGTKLCVMKDSPLAEPTIARRFRLPFCEQSQTDQSTAYLIQSIQSVQYPVPLVADRDALLRVFPISKQSTEASIPPAKATLFVDGQQVYSTDIAGQSTPIPSELTYAEASLDRSANIRIPGSMVQPGLEMVIDIDPAGTLDASLEMVRRIPESGRMPIRVERMPGLELTMIPFIWQTQRDSTAMNLIDEMVQDPAGHRLFSETQALLPVKGITLTAHPPVLTSTNDGNALLDEVSAIRLLEGGTGYWMGALSGEALGPWGVAWIHGWTSYVQLGIADQPREALTIAHELGHNMSLYHAPCGVTSVLDPGYPYPNAAIGTWGVDSRSGTDLLIPSSRADMMSYCVPAWISEYNFYLAMTHRLNLEASAKQVAASVPTLLVWGGADEEGAPYLNPIFAVDAPPSLPDKDGVYELVGRSINGEVLFSIAFDMKSVADTEGRSGFAFTIPASPEWIDILADVELTGPAGSTRIDAGSNRSALILRERSSGRVRALLRDVSAATISLDAAAARLFAPDTDLEILYSRGLPQRAQR